MDTPPESPKRRAESPKRRARMDTPPESPTSTFRIHRTASFISPAKKQSKRWVDLSESDSPRSSYNISFSEL
jgi:hypothetical protein